MIVYHNTLNVIKSYLKPIYRNTYKYNNSYMKYCRGKANKYNKKILISLLNKIKRKLLKSGTAPDMYGVNNIEKAINELKLRSI